MFKRYAKLYLVLFIFFLCGFFIQTANGATTGIVTATVTAQNVSVTVSDGTISYGTLSLNASQGTVGLTDTQTVTNNGNIAEDFTIKGQNSTNWTLDTTNVTLDHYIHRFCTTSCSSPPTSYTALTTNYQTLATNIAASGTSPLDLYITTPQTSSVYTSQSVDVTVQATAH